jgi:polyhydroxybutyrate depolymerase
VALAALLFVVRADLAPGEWQRRNRSDPAKDNGSIQIGSVGRTYILHLPSRVDLSKPIPLVLAFHGGGGQGSGMVGLTGFDEVADRDGFAVAYPDGIGRHWADFRELSDRDDVAFVRALIDLRAKVT